jgi:hypothetical protein
MLTSQYLMILWGIPLQKNADQATHFVLPAVSPVEDTMRGSSGFKTMCSVHLLKVGGLMGPRYLLIVRD